MQQGSATNFQVLGSNLIDKFGIYFLVSLSFSVWGG